MPLNKLDNFIKNTEGRILYVSPSDLDSTDSISNEGNSLARPFKTLQRALIESARFSYVKGRSNDIVEKTTILLMPGEHTVDNRPGFRIYNNVGTVWVQKVVILEYNWVQINCWVGVDLLLRVLKSTISIHVYMISEHLFR